MSLLVDAGDQPAADRVTEQVESEEGRRAVREPERINVDGMYNEHVPVWAMTCWWSRPDITAGTGVIGQGDGAGRHP